jgi:hypothetical protein
MITIEHTEIPLKILGGPFAATLASLLLLCVGTAVEWYSCDLTLRTGGESYTFTYSLRLFSVCYMASCGNYARDDAKLIAAQTFAILSCVAAALHFLS